MTTVAAIVLGIALFCWWLTGNWYARAVAYLPIIWVAVNLGGDFKWSPAGCLYVVAGLALGWIAVSLPIWLRRPAPTPAAVAAARSTGSAEALPRLPRG